jgi:hypothetical protein
MEGFITMGKAGKTGVTAQTPSKIMFGAGTIHRGLSFSGTDSYVLTTDAEFVAGKTYYTKSGGTYTATTQNVGAAVTANTYYEKKVTAGTWNFEESIVGATSGGSVLSIVPEFVHVEADGALVKVKGLEVKTGETAKLEINFLELTEEIIKAAAIAKDGTSEDSNYTLLESKAAIEEGDYWENIAFVGKTLEGKNIIAILDNALCTSGLELGGENKKESVGKYTFESHADLTSDLDTLPYHIYYPKAA